MSGAAMRVIRQVYVRRDRSGPRVVARSPGVEFADEELALRVAVRFGPRPAGARCPGAVFAVAAGSAVAVVRAADLTAEGTDPPLGFRVLLVDRAAYSGDPFDIDRRFPPNWSATSDLARVELPAAPPPRRLVADVQAILKYGDGPLLLGTAQALIDGGRVAVQRSGPDPDFVRGVWQLLPDRVRVGLWPATFAFSAELGFHVVALPYPPASGYLAEDQAKDYPEGRYELALQTATEAGDQAELDRLFARKSSAEVLRTAVAMVVFAVLVAVVLRFF